MANRHQPPEGDNGAWEFPPGRELGPLLRTRREELGLRYGDVTARIKVKERYLEAIENEAWDRLPAPTFVKGFIRAYARVLGLSEERLVALYEESGPPAAQPLVKTVRRRPAGRRVLPYLAGILAVLVAGAAGYVWMTPGWLTERPAPAGNTLPAEQPGNPPPQYPQNPSPGPGDKERKGGEEPLPAGARPKTAESLNPQAESATRGTAGAVPTPSGDRAEPERSVPNAGHASRSDYPLILKATARERTWVKVTIDNEKPREYTLNPDSRPEWRAHKGFELLIGNAGGLDLELNGRKLGRLGRPGQVVKLRLPSTDERSASEE